MGLQMELAIQFQYTVRQRPQARLVAHCTIIEDRSPNKKLILHGEPTCGTIEYSGSFGKSMVPFLTASTTRCRRMIPRYRPHPRSMLLPKFPFRPDRSHAVCDCRLQSPSPPRSNRHHAPYQRLCHNTSLPALAHHTGCAGRPGQAFASTTCLRKPACRKASCWILCRMTRVSCGWRPRTD